MAVAEVAEETAAMSVGLFPPSDTGEAADIESMNRRSLATDSLTSGFGKKRL